MTELRERVAKGVAWSLLGHGGKHIVSVTVFIVLSRLLEPEAFGIVALAWVFVGLVNVLIGRGFAQAIIQRENLDDEHLDTAFWICLSLGTLMAIIGVLLSGPIASIYGEPRLAPILNWITLSFVLTGLSSVQRAILQRNMAFRVLAVRNTIAEVVGGIVGISCAVNGLGVWSLVTQTLCSGAAGTLILWSTCDWRPGLRFSRQRFSELFKFATSMVLDRMLEFLNRHGHELLIGYFLGTLALGYYTIGSRVIRVLTWLLVGTTNVVAFSAFSRLQLDRNRMRRSFLKAIQLASAVSFPVFLGLTLLAPELVRNVFGTKWQPSTPIIQALAFTGLLQSLLYFHLTVLVALGRPSWRLGVNLLGTVLNFVGFLIAVRWGIVAVAVAFAVHSYLTSPLLVWLIRRLLAIDFSSYCRNLAPAVVSSIVMLVFVFIAKSICADVIYGSLELLICISAGVVGYVSSFWLTAPLVVRESLGLLRLALPSIQIKRA